MDINIKRGDTETFQITVTEDGQALNLTGMQLKFTAKKSFGGAVVISKTVGSGITVTDAANGICEISIDPADTTALPNHQIKLVYDVQLTYGVQVRTIAEGEITVRPDVSD